MLRPYSIYLHSPLHFITDEHLFYILHEQLGRCYYCHRRIGSASSTIWHCINEHNGKGICILLPRALACGTKRYRAVHFNVVPATLSCDIENIVFDEVTMTIKVANDKQQRNSPPEKVVKSSTPMKTVHCQKQLFKPGYDDEEEGDNKHKDIHLSSQISSIDDYHVEELKRLLPHAVDFLREHGQLDDWMHVMRQLAGGTFPVDNIAYRLFLDVVNFHEHGNIFAMQYSANVKQFWAAGYRLFKSKFVRFMGGLKCQGQDQDNQKGSSAQAKVNFVCPDLKTLRQETEVFEEQCAKPGILYKNIQNFSVFNNHGNSCKLAFDGKKISMGFGKNLGDVDLFGNESPPTLAERVRTLENEKNLLRAITDILDHMESKNKVLLPSIVDENSQIYSLSKDIITSTGLRIKALRELKLKKQYTYERLL